MNRRVLLSRICASSCICTADNSSQILKERIWLLAFETTTFNERNSGNGDFRFEYKKTNFAFCWICWLAGWKRFSSVRQEKKLDELTLGFSEFVRLLAESGWRTNLTKRQKKEIQTHWQPEKRENPFRAVVKVLKRKIFSTSFSLFDFKTDRKNKLKNKKTEYLFVNLFSVQRFNFKKKENINLTTNLSVFGWKMRFNRRLNCGFRSESSLIGRNLNYWKTTNYDHLTHALRFAL